jgi:hypothetical protein
MLRKLLLTLVIVIVVALLVVLTFPLWSSRPYMSIPAQTSCIGNLKQLTLALRMYASDYPDHLPATRCWPLMLRPYLAGNVSATVPPAKLEMLLCPMDERQQRQSCAGLPTSYTMNAVAGDAKSKMANGAQFAVMWDGLVLSGGRESFAPRHYDLVDAGFVDGHVKAEPAGELAKLTTKPAAQAKPPGVKP